MFKDLTKKQIYYFFGLKILEISAVVGGYFLLVIIGNKYILDTSLTCGPSCGAPGTYLLKPFLVLIIIGFILFFLAGLIFVFYKLI
jgi:hypothetical protein